MMRALMFLMVVVFCWSASAQQWQHNVVEPSTYSILAWDSATGDIGIALQSTVFSAGAVLPFAKANLGGIIVQGNPDPQIGSRAFELLQSNTPRQTADRLMRTIQDTTRIQFAILDSTGECYVYTGKNCPSSKGYRLGSGYSVQGTYLRNDTVLQLMSEAYLKARGDFAGRLLASLEAADKAEGKHVQRRSAALLVVRDGGGYGGFNDRYIDLRVDDDSLPLVSLRKAFERWQAIYSLDARLRTIEYFNKSQHFLQADNEKKRLIESMNAQIRLKPDDANVLNNVAWTMAISNIDYERALEFARRAVRLEPDNSTYLNTMAECFYRLGGYEDAIAIESELVSKHPDDPYYYRQLLKFKEAKPK